MIRINLLGLPKTKRGKRPALATPEFTMEGTRMALVALVLVLITALGNGAWFLKLRRDQAKVQHQLQVAEQENRRLSEVKAKYLQREQQKNSYKHRVDIIDQLRKSQSGPVDLLAMLSQTVNATGQIWLSTMNETSSTIQLEGVALSVHSVADLMRNLQRSGMFKSVEIKESFQDATVKDMQAFVFTLVCEKQQQKS